MTREPLGGGGAGRRLGVSSLDQAISSASNFLLVFVLARLSSPTDLGLMILGYAILTLGVSINRNAFGAILGIDLPTRSAEERVDLIRRSTAASLALSVAIAVSILAYALVIRQNTQVTSVLLVLALVSPLVLVQDLQRYWTVADGRPGIALLADCCWLIPLMLAFTGIGLPSGPWAASMGTAAYAVGAALSILVFVLAGYWAPPRWDRLLPWAWGDQRRRDLALDAVLAAAAPLGNASGAAVLSGPAVTAAVRGTGTLFGPLNVLATAMLLAAVPEARRTARRTANRISWLVTIGLTCAAAAWGAVLIALPSSVGTYLLGETWFLVSPLIWLATMEYIGIGMWTGATVLFRIDGAIRRALVFRIVYSAAALVVPLVSLAFFRTAESFYAALAGLAVIMGTAALATAHRRART